MKAIVDVKAVLAPISKKNPVGEDLRADQAMDALYYQLKDLRTESRDIERRQSLGEGLDVRPPWPKLAKLAVQALQEKSKDLEIASWLTEALLRMHGFSGLASGFSVMADIAEKYWDKAYPLPDEDGLETRLAPIIGLNGDEYDGTLIRPIAHVDITKGSSTGPFALWQYQQAIENNKITDKELIKKKQEQGSIFMSDIQAAVAESGSDFYQQLQTDLDAALSQYKRLNSLLEEKCGHDAPPKIKVLQALEHFGDHIRYITKDAPFSVKEAVASEASAAAEVEQRESVVEPAQKNIHEAVNTGSSLVNNRDAALKQLGTIADYFRQAEPQSPLPFLLERAQQLGKMSFPELLKELVDDNNAREAACKLMGME